MSLIDEFMTPEEQWQTTENFKLAREFLREYLDDPGSFRDLVNGNTIVLLPSAGPDDVELTHMNLQMAHELRRVAVLCAASGWVIDREPARGQELYRRYVKNGAIVPDMLFARHCPEPDWAGAQRQLDQQRWRHAKYWIRRAGAASLALGLVLLVVALLRRGSKRPKT